MNWNRFCDAFISGNIWSFLILLFVGGDFGSSLTVGIKTCRRRCWSGSWPAAGPERAGRRPPIGVGGAERAGGATRPDPGHRRTLGDGWAWGQSLSNIAFLFTFETGPGPGWSTTVVMCRVPCFLWCLIVTRGITIDPRFFVFTCVN